MSLFGYKEKTYNKNTEFFKSKIISLVESARKDLDFCDSETFARLAAHINVVLDRSFYPKSKNNSELSSKKWC